MTDRDPFAELLAARDEALARGDAPPPLPEVPAPLAERLRRAAACLRLFEEVWPRSDPPTRTADDAAKAEPTPRPEAPRKVGRFTLVRELGRGGSGIVYLALDPTLHRRVALKVPKSQSLLLPDQRRRFLLEAQAAAALTHPNLVSVYEAGEADGACYIASAYCEGLTLAAWLQRQPGPIPVRVAAALAAVLAEAVHYMHRRNVLHLDLKPGNVLLHQEALHEAGGLAEEQPAPFTPMIMDFGLAQLWGRAALGPEGGVLGTPLYMAPEQAAGRGGPVGPATDVYALGVILYELLTGRPPFRGSSEQGVLARVQKEAPESPRAGRPEVPRDLELICLKCLEKDPGRRYASAGRLADDLGRFLADEPTEACPLNPWQATGKWCRRHPAAAALILVSLLAVAALLAGAGWHVHRLQNALAEVDRHRAEAEGLARHERQLLKVAHLRLAHQAWLNVDLERSRSLLRPFRRAPGPDDERCFAWHYLWRLCHSERLALRGHAGAVYYAAYSPDGTTLASCGEDGTVRLWDPATGRERLCLEKHPSEVNGLAFAPDGKTLATAADDGHVRLWDVATGRPGGQFQADRDKVFNVAFLGPHTLAVVGPRFPPTVWDLRSQKVLFQLTGHKGEIHNLTLSRDGRTLATAATDDRVLLWDAQTGKRLADFRGHAHTVLAVALSPNGTLAASAGMDETARVWDTATGKELHKLTGHTSWVQGVAFAPDGRTLATAGRDGTVRLWDPATGRLRRLLRAHSDKVWWVAYSSDGQTLATTGGDGEVKLWDAQATQEYEPVPGLKSQATALAFAPRGGPLAVGLDDGTLGLHGPGEARELRGHTRAVLGLAYSPAGDRLASAGLDHTLRIWDVEKGAERFRFEEPAPVCATAFAPGGRQVVAGLQNGTVVLRDAATGELVWRKPLFPVRIHALAYAPGGRVLALAGRQDFVRLLDPGAGEVRERIHTGQGVVTGLAFSPDGKLLATVGENRSVKLWDVATGQEQRTLLGHTDHARSVAFAPDGRVLATGGRDRTVRVWDLTTGQEVLTLEGHAGAVNAVAFAADGRSLASGSSGQAPAGTAAPGEVFLWKAAGD